MSIGSISDSLASSIAFSAVPPMPIPSLPGGHQPAPMVGKAERGPAAIEAIRDNKSAYLMAVGGSAYLVSKAIKAARVVGFADLGMEAIYEFTVQDMPVTVAVDASGESVHQTGPREWQARIGKIPVVVA